MKKALSILTLLFLLSFTVKAQDDKKPDWMRWHYLSEEEMYDKSRGMNFVETDPPTGEPRFVAEFEPMQGVMVSYASSYGGFGIPVNLIAQLAENCHLYCIVPSSYQGNAQNTMQNGGVNMSNVTFVNAPVDSYWIRDYGPWYIFEDRNPAIVDNIYNRPRYNDDNMSSVFANFWNIPMYGMKVEHTGGNMMEDGRGHGVSDDLVFQENMDDYNINEATVRQRMRDYLGIDPYHVTIDPQGDYIAHVDCWGKYLAPDKILIARLPQSNPRYQYYEQVAQYFETTNCCWGYPYHVYRVDEPGGNTLAPYTNSLILNKTVYVPLGSNSTYNNQALAVYQEAMPGYNIVGVPGGSAGWLNTDALHCRTRGVMDFNMLFVDHRDVLFGEQAWQDSIAVTSKFIAYSGQNLKQDSLLVYYSIDGGAYQTAHMTATGNPDEYVGYIKGYQGESEIDYYVFGADMSGHRYTQPVFAGLDPHHFTMEAHEPTPPGELVVSPETLTFEEPFETHTFQIINETENSVTISAINVNPNDNILLLSHANLPQTLQPNQSMNVEVELNGMGSKGYNTYTITVVTSVGDRQVTVRVNEEAWDEGLVLMPMQGLTFGPNASTTQTFYLKNTNALRSITLNDIYEDGSNYFNMEPSHSLPYSIQAGERFAVTVTLVDFPEQETTANVFVNCSDYAQSTTYFTIGAFPPPPQGELVITPDTLWFDNMGDVRSFIVNNGTNDAVTIQDIIPEESALVFEEITLPYTLLAGQTVTVAVRLLTPPAKDNYFIRDINVQTSLGERHVTAMLRKTAFDYGLAVVGSPTIEIVNENGAEGVLTNRNYGTQTPIDIYSIAEDGTNYLNIVPQHTLPYTLQPSDFFTVTFYANSSAKGTVNTMVYVESSDRRCEFFVTIEDSLFSITELSAEAKLYPNPTTGQFTVEGANVERVEVYNLVGQKVHEAEGQVVNIDDANWRKGIYLVNIIEQNGTMVAKKLVVK